MAGLSFRPLVRGLVVTPGASYAVASAAAAVVAACAPDRSRPAAWLAVTVVIGVLVLELLTSPPYLRDRTRRPVRRILVTAGAGLLAASASALLDPEDVRWSGAAVLAAVVVLVGAAALVRIAGAPRTVLLVGGRVGVGQLVAQWAACPDVDVVGVCLPESVHESVQSLGPVPILGSVDDVAAVALASGVDEVVLVPGPLLSAPHVRRLIWALEKVPAELSVVAEMDGVVPRRVTPRVLGRRLTFSVRPGGPALPALWVKGVVDRLAAAVLLVVLSPLLLLAAIVIRLDSPGPAVFRQTRVGLDGRPFTIFKLRTMLVDAEARLSELTAVDEGAGPLFKMALDPRTTRVGRTLRRTSIDEVPQLLNVLRGEMSLIGPRPGLPVETMTYDEWVHRRLRVKPGMTGAWQVGGRSNLSWTDSVRLDIDYVDNARLRDDLRIAVKTARVVVSRDGAV
ncbi:MAG: exopolysaccharide biosynthesis polyprenyl glycosylphosphotransferase [Aeromicrobium sp.]